MDQEHVSDIISTSLSLGVKLFGRDATRTLHARYNTSLAEDPAFCMRLRFMVTLGSEDFAAWLYSKDKIALLGRVQKYIRVDLNENPQSAGCDLANDLCKIASETNDNTARIMAAAAMALFYDAEGVREAALPVACSYLKAFFEEDYGKAIDLLVEADQRICVLLFIALWKTNYDGVSEALADKLQYNTILTGPEKEALMLPKKENRTPRDMSLWDKVATNFYTDLGFSPEEYNPFAFILILLLSYREEAASVITQRHPEFAPMEQAVRETNGFLHSSESFNDVYYEALKHDLEALGDLNKANPALHDDIYFSLYMAAHGSFLYQGDREFWQKHVERVFSAEEELKGFGHLAMMVVALWSSDYGNFQSRLRQAVASMNTGDGSLC